ncbi:TPA: DUF433 domain-containing protein [Candidatus Poribacteria bacterium]|nr:DUF433 domain-containing protein [Candidatus Poribacteria bacterium]
MSLVRTDYEHIAIRDSVPIIAGTTIKVVELVTEKIAYGWSPEELHFQHPYLTLGQIYSALAYYWDHAEELNQDIERRLKHVEHIRRTIKPPFLIAQLKSRGARGFSESGSVSPILKVGL